MKRIVRKWLIYFASLTIGLLNSSALIAQIAGYQNTTVDIGAGFNGVVNAIAFQSDGKILVGGVLTSYKGIPCENLVRLNTDGTLDATFDYAGGIPETTESFGTGPVYAIVVLPDDKILIGGSMEYRVNGLELPSFVGISRLNPNGSLDRDYLNGSATTGPGKGANMPVYSIVRNTDGSVYLGGPFTLMDGTIANQRIAGLHASGQVNPTPFTTGSGFDAGASPVEGRKVTALLLDGTNLLAGGIMSSYKDPSGTTTNVGGLSKISLADGTLDAAFQTNVLTADGEQRTDSCPGSGRDSCHRGCRDHGDDSGHGKRRNHALRVCALQFG